MSKNAGPSTPGAALSPSAASPPLFEFSAGDSPLLISFPHSGTYLPPEIAARLQPGVLDLPDTDWFVPRLYDWHRELGASILAATHSRFVVDLNRPPDGAPLYPGQRETTVCPVETFDGEALYAPGDEPSSAEVLDRLARYWRPYHERLAEHTSALVKRHGYCVLWDAHSIHSSVPGLFAGRLPDLNLGTADGRSCSPERQRAVADCLSGQTTFTHVVNGRFKGGYITRHYGDPQRRIDALQLEIAQSAYLEEARVPVFSSARASSLREFLQKLLGVAASSGDQ